MCAPLGKRLLVLSVLLPLVAFLIACAGEAQPATPTPSPTSAASATPAVSPTPRPTSTPLPTVVPPPVSGRVTARLIVTCELGPYGPEIRVRYGGSVTETDDPRASITRIRLYVDGSLRADSGPLSHRIYVQEARFDGRANGVHRARLHVETWAAPEPAELLQFTQCPAAPDGPFARGVS